MLARVHATFRDVVLSRRGAALAARSSASGSGAAGVALTHDAALSGEVWTGAEAADNGMVDAVGDLGPVLRETFGPVRCA